MTAVADLLNMLPGNRWAWVFEALDVCGEVMAAEGVVRDLELDMTVLAPPQELIGMRMELYRSHCAELIGRWKTTRSLRDLSAPTNAELLAGMVAASQAAPLSAVGAAVYARLFLSVLPDFADLVEDVGRERYPGQVSAEIDSMRKQLRVRTTRSPGV